MTFERALRETLEELGLAANSRQLALLCSHFRLLRKWNRRINLTRVSEPAEAARRHYGESAFLHAFLPETESAVDVGSGAGFPGIPFAALRPQTQVTLVESKVRKAAFLREATRDWPNVSVANCRLADWKGHAEWALMRAVAPSSVLPDLRGRSPRVAILGTARPADEDARGWDSRSLPWSDRMALWTGEVRPQGRNEGVASRPRRRVSPRTQVPRRTA